MGRRPRSQRIGNRPNLRQLIPAALQTGQWVGVQFTGTVPAHQTRRWFTFRWPAHWHVVWTVVPTPTKVAAQKTWSSGGVGGEEAYYMKYWTITNMISEEEGSIERHDVLGGWWSTGDEGEVMHLT